MAKRRPPDEQPAHPAARRLAGEFARITDYRRVPAVRQAKNRVLRAGSVIQEARALHTPASSEGELRALAADVHRACVEVLKALPPEQLEALLAETIAAEPDEVKRRIWARNPKLFAKFPDLCVSAVSRLPAPKEGGNA